MHYHLITTDGAYTAPSVRTLATADDAEREALRVAMLHDDWEPKRYPGRIWKRGEIGVYRDRSARPNRAPSCRILAIVRCLAASDTAHDCVRRALDVPALDLTSYPPIEPSRASRQSERPRSA